MKSQGSVDSIRPVLTLQGACIMIDLETNISLSREIILMILNNWGNHHAMKPNYDTHELRVLGSMLLARKNRNSLIRELLVEQPLNVVKQHHFFSFDSSLLFFI